MELWLPDLKKNIIDCSVAQIREKNWWLIDIRKKNDEIRQEKRNSLRKKNKLEIYVNGEPD